MYSILHSDGTSKKTAKGISSNYQRKRIMHSDYVLALKRRKVSLARVTRIRAIKHQLYTVSETKVALNSFNDKRYFASDQESLAFGHYRINQIQQQQ